MKIAFNLEKYSATMVRELMYVTGNWTEGIRVLLILDDFTKGDLKELLDNLDDDDQYKDLFNDLKKDLTRLLDMNKGRQDHSKIEWIDTRGRTTLDEFINAQG